MSRFLQSLVARHAPGVDAATSALQVRPRPKARFEETAYGVGGSAMQDSAGIQPAPPYESVTRLNETDFATSAPVMRPPRAQAQAPGKMSMAQIDALPARGASPSSAPVVGRKKDTDYSALLRPSAASPVLPSAPGPRDQPFATTEPFAAKPVLSSKDDSDARHVGALRTRGADVRSKGAAPEPSMSADDGPYPDAVTQGRAQPIEPRPRERGEQRDNSRVRGAELLAPAWLPDVQQALLAALNTGGAKLAEAPSITVTIGQVDVRAETSAKEHRSSTGDAPSGIMTLETYLKQRDRGR